MAMRKKATSHRSKKTVSKAQKAKSLMNTLTRGGTIGSSKAKKLHGLLQTTVSGPGVEGALGGGTRPSPPKKKSPGRYGGGRGLGIKGTPGATSAGVRKSSSSAGGRAGKRPLKRYTAPREGGGRKRRPAAKVRRTTRRR
jgi:hypothetical protein